MSVDKHKQAADIADDLIGTCQTAPEAMREDDAVEALVLDIVFECERCGWWCSTDELHNEDGREFCEECHNDEC